MNFCINLTFFRKKNSGKNSTISFTLSMTVDHDRVKRIQSAHAMRKSKERDHSALSQNDLKSLESRKGTMSGLEFDDW